MKRKALVLVSLVLFVGNLLYAQSNMNTERRRMNDKLLDLVDSYEQYSAFSDEYMQYAFADLFQAADTKVYCDYIASPKFGTQISASEYADYSTNSITVRSVSVNSLRRVSLSKDETDTWVATLAFIKHLEYADEIGTCFSTEDPVFGTPYIITVECSYDSEKEQFVITSLSGSPDGNSKLPRDKFLIFERKDVDQDQLRYNDAPLESDMFGQIILTDGGKFSTTNPNLFVNVLSDTDMERYQKINLTYKFLHFRLVPHASFTVSSAYEISSENDEAITSTSGAMEYGLDLGYTFKMGPRLLGGFYTGIALSNSNIDLEASNVEYSYRVSDQERVQYTRAYSLEKIKEGLEFKDYVIPFYLSFERNFDKVCSVNLEGGVKVYLNSTTTLKPYNVEHGYVTAVYASPGDVYTNDISGEYTRYLSPADYSRNTYDLSAFGRFGIDVNIYKNRLLLMLKAGYEMGLQDSYASNQNVWFDDSRYFYPFVYSSKSGGEIAVRSFVDCISYKRQALFVDLGIKLKF